MTIGTDGRIPIRFEPVHGESFDGWLDSYAQRLLMSGVELGAALGVRREILRLRCATIALGDHTLDADRVAELACDIDPAAVRALWLGLARYQRLVTARTDGGWLGRATRPLGWSRFCPTCLRENGGRWLAAWRLPWFLACPNHLVLLACTCARCGGTQREGGLRIDHVPELMTSCCRATAPQAGRGDNRCRADLTAPAATAPAAHDLLALQTELIALLDPTLSDDQAEKLVERLVDVLVVATHVGLDARAIDGDRHNATSVLAGPLAEAHVALTNPHGPQLHALANDDRSARLYPLPTSWNAASPTLTIALLQHRDTRLRPTDRLRFRSMTGSGRRPEGADWSKRLRASPLALWPDWSIRLRPPVIEATNFRISAAIALCVPGTMETVGEIMRNWPDPHPVKRLVRFCRIVAHDPHGTAILGALCALSDELDRNGAPIDYDRRRMIASETELLTASTWASMCRTGGTPTGGAPKLREARLSLWETLTAGLARQAPPSLRMQSSLDVARHERFALRLTGDTARALRDHARGLLDANDCRDEPLTWSPCGDRVAPDSLPGPDPDTFDPQRAHALLGRQIAHSRIAERLGITLEHLHYVLREHPPDDPFGERPRENQPSAPRRKARFAARITPDELRQLVDDGNTLTSIADSYQVDRSTVHAELVAHGIPIPRRQPRYTIERDWLHEQYIEKHRSMPEIAAMTGAATTTILRLLRRHKIPARSPGHHRLTVIDSYPEPLASAVRRPGGAERVRRFQIYARTRSLRSAAQRLAIKSSTLTAQLGTLEADCDGALIERTTPLNQRSQQITALGQTLLGQADCHLGPHPDAPPNAPEPLASVLRDFRGHHKLATFATAAACRSLAEAATILAIKPSSLQRTVQKLEGVVGAPLLTDHRRMAPLHLTPIARRLLQQHADHDATPADRAGIRPDLARSPPPGNSSALRSTAS